MDGVGEDPFVLLLRKSQRKKIATVSPNFDDIYMPNTSGETQCMTEADVTIFLFMFTFFFLPLLFFFASPEPKAASKPFYYTRPSACAKMSGSFAEESNCLRPICERSDHSCTDFKIVLDHLFLHRWLINL